jgi:SWIM zinc finger
MATITRKVAKAAGKRTVVVVPTGAADVTTVLVDDGKAAALYDLSRAGCGTWRVQKVDADGEPLGRFYVCRVAPPSCTCEGHRHGYLCRHVSLLTALLGRGKLAAA